MPDEYIDEMKQFFQHCPESSFENVSLVFQESTGKQLDEVFTGNLSLGCAISSQEFSI